MEKIRRAWKSYLGLWDRLTGKKRMRMFLGVYTLLFLLAALLVYSPFLLANKSFIWASDGRYQHYQTLAYIGRYWRAVGLNILHGKLQLPMVDFSLSLGGDIIGTLGTHDGFGDPLNLLAVFVPTRYIEYLYNFLFAFRIYLAGLSFCALCSHHGKRAGFSIIGALMYCFSGYALFAIRHPTFINPMIQLPLLLIGIDRILRKKKPYLFIAAVFYAALCGYYFLYMMTLAVGIYALISFFDVYRTDRLREFGRFVGRGAGSYLLGLGLAGVIFCPIIFTFLASSRTVSATEWDLFSYGWEYYYQQLLRLVAPLKSDYSLSMAAITLFSLVILWKRRGKNRKLKILFTITAAAYIFPVGSGLMNGLSYPTPRWTFIVALLLSYITVEVLPELLDMTRKEQLLCLAILGSYAVFVFSGKQTREAPFLVGTVMLSITLVVLLISSSKDARKKVGMLLCTILIVWNVGINAVFYYAADQGNFISAFPEYGLRTERLVNGIERKAEPYIGGEPQRFDGSSFLRNMGIVWHIPMLSMYWSTLSGDVCRYNYEVENAGLTFSLFSVRGSDQRTFYDALMSVGHVIEKRSCAQYVPFGYEKVRTTDDKVDIYQNKYALPLGYTYERTLSNKELEELNGLNKQEAMLEGIALDYGGEQFPQAKIKLTAEKIPFEITKQSNVEWADETLKVTKSNGSITLKYSVPAGTECYVRLCGYELPKDGPSNFDFGIEGNGVEKGTRALSPAYTVYFGRTNYLFNLGYSEQERTSCTITFPKKGVYRLVDIEVYAQPMDNYVESVEKLRAEPMKNIEFGTNQITGTVELSKEKILCLSVPYSKGWTAKVDGQKVEILKGNYMFMALPLTAGHHDIEFRYCSPGIKMGAVAMCVSLVVLGGMLYQEKRRRRNQ